MKYLFFFLLFSCNTPFSQQATIENKRQNIMYCGVDFPLSVLIENYSCNTVKLSTDNGSIYNHNCFFSCRPNKVGLATITVWLKKGHNRRQVAKKVFRVKLLPPPVASIGYLKDSISKKALLAMGGLFLRQQHWDFDAPLTLNSYSVLVFRNHQLLFWKENTGNIFTDDTIAALKELNTGDTILINNIRFEMPTIEMEKNVAPLQFIIQD